jgi:hypothetical protein
VRGPWLLLGLTLIACVPEPEPGRARDASPGDVEVDAAELPSEAECRECHPEAAAQWADSRHHAAFVNPDFQRAYAREPDASSPGFCRDCHAPSLASASIETRAEAEALGVGCHDCHVDAGVVVTGPGRAPAAPHALEVRDGFATDSCARCHEFEFPPGSRRAGELMQLTMTEHRASPFADRSCGSCHLPRGDHSLASTRDPEALARAVTATATREGDDLLVTLTPHEIGHAFPTGDLYRRLEIHAERRVDGRRVASATRYLDREFVPWRARDGRINPRYREPVVDDRVREPTTVRLSLADPDHAPGGELIWSLDYERVDARDDLDLAASTLASEVRLAAGRCTLAECERR